jgi:predicted transcriptional regulator
MSDRHALTPYSLRISAELRGRLEASARKIKRSLNAEIEARLEDSLNRDGIEGANASGINLGTLFNELQDVKEQLELLNQKTDKSRR